MYFSIVHLKSRRSGPPPPASGGQNESLPIGGVITPTLPILHAAATPHYSATQLEHPPRGGQEQNAQKNIFFPNSPSGPKLSNRRRHPILVGRPHGPHCWPSRSRSVESEDEMEDVTHAVWAMLSPPLFQFLPAAESPPHPRLFISREVLHMEGDTTPNAGILFMVKNPLVFMKGHRSANRRQRHRIGALIVRPAPKTITHQGGAGLPELSLGSLNTCCTNEPTTSGRNQI